MKGKFQVVWPKDYPQKVPKFYVGVSSKRGIVASSTSLGWKVLGGADSEAVSEVLPTFGRGGRPKPEARGDLARIHALAVAAVLIGLAYLVWRWLFTIDLAYWWVAIPLILAETHNILGLGLFTLALWDVDRSPPWHAVDKTDLKVAVLIPTLNEPEEVLLPTIAAAVALKPAHETWVLDDGHRPEVHALARELGAHYLTRPDNQHYKAGNMNYAMSFIQADIFAVFDADHVAGPNFLRHTLAYFDDPSVAVVQTPQDFYNTDSFEHQHQKEEAIFHEEAVFYRVIAPGKNLWHGAFWCGTCSLVRYEALKDVGGVATESVTEDIHTTIRMNRKGWKGIYHNEVLARGLAPSDAIQYMVQRNRWAVGAMQVLRIENPLFSRGLTFGQRLSFATTILAWFDSWRTLTFILLPAAVIFTGASPINAPGSVYVPAFLLAFLSQFFALRLLARGYYPPVLSLVFEVLRLPAVLPATLAVFSPHKRRAFKVTSKSARDDRDKINPPQLLVALMAVSCVSIVWFLTTMFGYTTTDYGTNAPAVIGAFIFACINFWLLTIAVKRIRAAQYAGNRRNSFRFEVFLRGKLEDQPCVIRDVSLTGARVESPVANLQRGQQITLSVPAGDETYELKAEVVRVWPGSIANAVALRFSPGQRQALGAIALYVLNGRIRPEHTPRQRGRKASRQIAAA
jgi:cellulose synthase/poly-beta-1,6-N-acetylglucosamine synthase-like glycosyltransferase